MKTDGVAFSHYCPRRTTEEWRFATRDIYKVDKTNGQIYAVSRAGGGRQVAVLSLVVKVELPASSWKCPKCGQKYYREGNNVLKNVTKPESL